MDESKKGPIWKHFYQGANKYKTNRSHFEVWCKYCIDAEAQQQYAVLLNEASEDGKEVEISEEDLILSLRTSSSASCGKVEDMWKHLAEKCKCLSDLNVRVEAAREVTIYRARRAKSAADKENVHSQPPPSTPITRPTVSAFTALSPNVSLANQQLASPLQLSSAPRASRPLGLSVSTSSIDSSASSAGDGPPATKRPRLSAENHPDIFYGETAPYLDEWTPQMREEFNRELCCLLVACNIAWWAVENRYWRYFFSKWVRGCIVPGRKQISGRVLDGEADRVVEAMKAKVNGRYATGQCDGWKNIAKTSLVASMINVEYTPHLLGVADISAQSKTAENLLEIVLKEIKYCREILMVKLVAWCTDASGESLKMRKLLRTKFPWIVTIDCWAHQINLVVGDYFKIKSPLIHVVSEALEVVKWFNNHSRALGLLRAQQMESNGLNHILSLILPVLTRWTSHYLSLSRLLRLQLYFMGLLLSSSKREALVTAAGPKAEQRRKAEEVIGIIERPDFWISVKILKNHLEPLAFATNITQSDFARLDVVLMTLANLYRIYSSRRASMDSALCSAILASLEKRWKKADQDVFILAVVLNPYIRTKAFHRHSRYRTMGALWPIVVRLGQRFWNGLEPDREFRKAFSDYLSGMGEWSDKSLALEYFKEEAVKDGIAVNLVDLWREHDTGCENGPNGLVRLAMHILSIVANSASTERVLSKFGVVHTRHRNRMDYERTRKIVLVKANIDATHRPKTRSRKRKFVDEEAVAPTSVPEEDSNNESTPDGTGDSEDGSQALPDPTFPEIVNDIISDLNDEESAHPELASEPAPSDNPLSLANLFEYPSFEGDNPPSLRYMLEYWAKAEESWSMEERFHEMENES